jgi:hypothetical protein
MLVAHNMAENGLRTKRGLRMCKNKDENVHYRKKYNIIFTTGHLFNKTTTYFLPIQECLIL